MDKLLNRELSSQYAHTWKLFEYLVADFDEAAWIQTGRKTVIPARLSFHILKATRYYLEDTSAIEFASGKSFESNCETVEPEALPSRNDIRVCIREFAQKTEKWIAAMDLDCPNPAFPWAGTTQLGVLVFLLKHTMYHLGELSSLLNESRNGEAEDNYVKALQT